MTAGAVGEILLTESANVVMTSPAANRAARRKMLDGDRHRNLSRLRRARSDRVAVTAVYALPCGVISVRKNGFENGSRGLRSAIRREVMADITRTDIAFRRVAGVAGRVSVYPDRNRFRRALRQMTRRTARRRSARAAQMRGVVEFHIKTFVKPRRKRFHRRRNGLQIVVAHHADARFGIGKFVQMTTDARIVSGKFQAQRIALAPVARIAVYFQMFGNAVRKLAVVFIGNFLRRWCSRVFRSDNDICFFLLQTARGKRRKCRRNEQNFDGIFRFKIKISQLSRLIQMTCRNFKTSDLRGMTIIAVKNRLFIADAFFAFADLVAQFVAVTRTRTARQKRHVGVGQHFQIRSLRDADMTNRAVFVRVIFARVIEFQRKTPHDARFEIRSGQPVTTRAVGARRFLSLVMTVKTRSVIVRIIFKEFGSGNKIFRRRIR